MKRCKQWLASVLVMLLILSVLTTASAAFTKTVNPETEFDDMVSHKFTGAEVTAVPDELKEPDSRGGTVLRFPKLDFSKPGTEFTYGNDKGVANELIYDEKGFYRYWVINYIRGQGVYMHDPETWIEIKPNRKYVFSVLIWMDHDRYNARGTVAENVLGLRLMDEYGNYTLGVRKGVPDYTNGWQRFEYEFSTGFDAAAKYASFLWQAWQLDNGYDLGNMCIADACLIELPEEEPREAYQEGEGLTFRGGAGSLDMRVEDAVQTKDKITVDTTGVRYTFNLADDTITAEQKVSKQREVCVWQSDIDLSNLSIKSTTEKECIVTCSEISFGVQMDGMLFLTPHQGAVNMTCTSKIGGMWNRLAYGNLTAMDNYGGFSVTPDIPVGTGKMPVYQVLTENLDFAQYQFCSTLYFQDDKPLEYNEYISNAKPGWQINWTVSPGERLAISVAPPREYDWEQSFHISYRNISYDSSSQNSAYQTLSQEYELDVVAAFLFDDRSYANEYKKHYTYSKYSNSLKNHIKMAHEYGMQVVPYLSAYFFPDHSDASAYMDEVTRLKNIYGFDGVYSDGLPSEYQWIVAYEDARMLRELFPDGVLVSHLTGVHENGGPPLSSPAHFIPGIETYLTATLKGEGVAALGIDTPLATMIWPNYNISNCIGFTKGDCWHYYNEEGEHVIIPQKDQDILGLEYNGRARMSAVNDWLTYLPIMRQLETLWKEHGTEEDFYERVYQPTARKLIRETAEKYGNILTVDDDFEQESLNPFDYGVYHASASLMQEDSNQVLQLKQQNGSGSLLKRISGIGGPLSVEYKFKVNERGNFDCRIADSYDTAPITLRFAEDGRICFKNNAGYFVGIGRYQKDTWTTVRFDIDTDAHTLEIYLNDHRAVSLPLSEKLYTISEVEFFTGGAKSVCSIDDFKIINKY